MITQLEPDSNIRKRLGNLMPKERIIWVDESKKILDLIVNFKRKIDLIISNLNTPYFYEIVKEDIFKKIYEKLKIPEIPSFGYYMKRDEKIEELIRKYDFQAIIYEDKNPEFTFKYLQIAKEKYPEIRVIEDQQKIISVWLGTDKEKELSKEEKNSIERILMNVPSQKHEGDYKAMYEEMKNERNSWKKKYEKLLDSIKNIISKE